MSGLVRIHVIAEATGVPEPTLRAWERRYGIPRPERTAAGYRLYGPRELDQVRRMRELCDAGVSASDAARQVRTGSSEPVANDAFDSARIAILDAITKFDIDAIEQRIQQTMFLGSPIPILERVVNPVLVEVGERWHAGELTVAQEHFASQRIGMLMRDLLRLVPVDAGAPRIVLGCFADDDHELGLLALAIHLANWGFRPVFLGARTPANAIRIAIRAVDAILVALSVTVAPGRARVRELLDEYAAACGEIPWLVGGTGLALVREVVIAAGGLVDPGDTNELRMMLDEAVDSKKRKT